MKNIFLIAFILFSVIGCFGNSNDEGASYSEINYEVMQEMSQETPEEDLLMGDFVSGSHVTTGKAVVNEEQTVLSLLNFKTDNGPIYWYICQSKPRQLSMWTSGSKKEFQEITPIIFLLKQIWKSLNMWIFGV